MSADEWRGFAQRPRSTPPARRPSRWASTSPGTASTRRPPRATTRSAAASTTRSPSRSPRRRSPTSSGWRPRPPISPRRASSPRRSTPSFPNKMLAYNLSPSFNWDTTGMSDDEMRRFPEELGKIGFVFNFITYGGHQIDGLAARSSPLRLKQDGMLALARLQRKFRLVESPYSTPQTLVGGPRADAALMASSGRTATTKAMGKGSTQYQHLIQTEVPKKLLEEWLALWSAHNELGLKLGVELQAAPRGLRAARARDRRRRRGEGGQRRLRPDPRPPGPGDPLGARPEHLRREAASEAADDASFTSSSSTATRPTRCTTSRRPKTTSTRRRR